MVGLGGLPLFLGGTIILNVLTLVFDGWTLWYPPLPRRYGKVSGYFCG